MSLPSRPLLAALAWFCATTVVASPVRAAERVRERVGQWLELEDGALRRLVEGEPVELGCTAEGGTGRVYDLAVDPFGLIFVAADAGVFVLGPDAEALDLVEFEGDAPPGSPRSVSVDAARNVWIATTEAVGVIDASYFFGRTLDRELLPGDGPYELRVRDSVLHVRSNAAAEPTLGTYAIGGTPPPAVTELRINGAAVAPGSTVELAYGDPPQISATGTAAGGATFRYRVDGHHVWFAPENERGLRVLSPGDHTLEVAAYDRDLRRSEPVLVELQIAYPFYYQPSFIVSVLLGFALVTVAAFAWGSRGAGLRGLARGVVSAGLLIVLVVQLLAGIFPHAKGWPFVGFKMYSDRYERGDVVFAPSLYGFGPDRVPFPISAKALGLNVDDRWRPLRPLIAGDREVARSYVKRYRARFTNNGLVDLQVRVGRVRLTPDGPVDVAPLILADHRGLADG